jgi:hypothetical protein
MKEVFFLVCGCTLLLVAVARGLSTAAASLERKVDGQRVAVGIGDGLEQVLPSTPSSSGKNRRAFKR